MARGLTASRNTSFPKAFLFCFEDGTPSPPVSVEMPPLQTAAIVVYAAARGGISIDTGEGRCAILKAKEMLSSETRYSLLAVKAREPCADSVKFRSQQLVWMGERKRFRRVAGGLPSLLSGT